MQIVAISAKRNGKDEVSTYFDYYELPFVIAKVSTGHR
jgi:hypothetical protein